ncbi:36337_t:CDS:2, partial [Racocetra persica]
SFIFSLGDADMKNAVLSRVKRRNSALNYEEYLGPSFGFDDITVNGENYREEMKCYSGNYSYEKPIRSEG